MNVLHINYNFNQSSLYEQLSISLTEHGCNHKVFYPSINGKEISNPPSFLEQVSILNKYDRLFFNKRNKKIVKYMKENCDLKNVDMFHAHSLFSNGMVAFSLKKEYNIPYIVAVRDTDINVFFKKMIHLRKKGLKILLEASRIVFLSKPYRDKVLYEIIPAKLRCEIEKKIEVIPNGINSYWLNNMNKSIKNNHNKIQILSVGIINKRKNILITAQACQLLMEKININLELLLVGEIKDQKYFYELKKYDFIKHITHQNKEELLDSYRKSDVFIMPSLTETFGLVYAEAMSQGLPVIYSRGQGFDEQFENGEVGYSVDKYDSKDVAIKLEKVIENRQFLSENCLRLVGKFSWDEISKEYIDIYQKMLTT